MSDDIRWLQRFANYTKALQRLSDAVALASQRPLSKLEQLGLIGSPFRASSGSFPASGSGPTAPSK